MDAHPHDPALPLAAAALATTPVVDTQPVVRVTRDGTEFILLGTAHVSRASVDAVREMIASESYDAVAVELCGPRAQSLLKPEEIAQMDLFSVIRQGRATAVGAGLALGAYQRRLARQFGIEPGAEMKAALVEAQAKGTPTWLVDRDVGVTLRRTRAAVGFWEGAKLSSGLLLGVLDDSDVDEASIERLKQGDVLAGTFSEFAKQSPPLFEALIAERDRYMAARLREEADRARERPRRVLAVVGAGHLDGLARALAEETAAPATVLAPLRQEPPPSQVGKIIGYLVIALVVGGFVWAFTQGKAVGIDMVLTWVITMMVTGAAGALLAGAHPLSIGAAALASPITPLHPALASGMVSGLVELWARKPSVGDFEALRDDLGSLRGWWRNRVSRVFLVFFLTNMGTVAGVWIAGVRMAAMAAEHVK